MIDLFKLRMKQGRQYISKVTEASLSQRFRGFPILDESRCDGCSECVEVCPTGAVSLNPLKIDMGKCLFCGECAAACPSGAIDFSNEHRLASSTREALVITTGESAADYRSSAVRPRPDLRSLFRRSFRIRSVSAGGCSACEMELGAIVNVNFDASRFGIDIVASPRHADAVVITGPITENMATALEETFDAVPEPKLLILMGACAISGGVFASSGALSRGFLTTHRVDLFLPGSPPHPLALINGLLSLFGRT